MKLGSSIWLAGLVTLGSWSIACSSDHRATGNDGGAEHSGGSTGSGGKGESGAGGNAGKAGEGGTAGQGSGGSAGMAGEGGGARDAGGSEPDSGSEPGVKIVAPADMSTISLGATAPDFPKIPISFEVRNFVLMAAATPVKQCPLGSCGHVHINVDEKDCNDVAKGAPYNVQGIVTPLAVDLGLCKHGVAGVHIVSVSLHNTDHSVVENAAGALIEDSITITAVSAAAEGGAPDSGAAKPDAGDGG